MGEDVGGNGGAYPSSFEVPMFTPRRQVYRRPEIEMADNGVAGMPMEVDMDPAEAMAANERALGVSDGAMGAILTEPAWVQNVENAKSLMTALKLTAPGGNGRKTFDENGWSKFATSIDSHGPYAILSIVPTPYQDEEKRKRDAEPRSDHLRTEFMNVTASSLMRGQGGSRWDSGTFLNYTFFPVIRSSWARDRTPIFVPSIFMCCYSSSKPSNSAVGHIPNFVPYNVNLKEIHIDVSLLSDASANLSIMAALETTRPAPGSYIWFTHMTSEQEYKSDGYRELLLSGASMGLSVAACVMGAPSVMYTGYIRREPADNISKLLTQSQYERGRANGNQWDPTYVRDVDIEGIKYKGIEALRTDDIVEEVQMVGMKAILALMSGFPLVMPHKTAYNGPLENIVKHYKSLSGLTGYRDALVSTVQFDQGIDYLAGKSPLLLATTLIEAVYLGGLAYLAYVVHPMIQVLGFATNENRVGTASINDFVSSQRAKLVQGRDAMVSRREEYRKDPSAYVEKQFEKKEVKHKESINKATNKLQTRLARGANRNKEARDRQIKKIETKGAAGKRGRAPMSLVQRAQAVKPEKKAKAGPTTVRGQVMRNIVNRAPQMRPPAESGIEAARPPTRTREEEPDGAFDEGASPSIREAKRRAVE